MKKLGLIILVASVGFFSSCNNDEEASVGVDLDSDITAESILEDVDAIADAGIATASSARTEGAGDGAEYISCATVTTDSVAHTITIDFGDGCEGPAGKVRSGTIIMTVSGRRFESGAYRSITFDNFSIDDMQIEGTRTITNITASNEDYPTYNVVMTGGKVTFADGTFITCDSDLTRVWYRMSNPLNDYTTLTGTKSGINRDGISYSSEITTELVFKRSCARTALIPVSGIKAITLGEEMLSMDYGDGTCDNLVNVTKDGETEEIEIEYNPQSPRRRFGR
jgi:hypothetical protein